jgi:hypothetical protein
MLHKIEPFKCKNSEFIYISNLIIKDMNKRPYKKEKYEIPDNISKLIFKFINESTFLYKNIQNNGNIQQGGNDYHKKYLKYKFKYNSIK